MATIGRSACTAVAFAMVSLLFAQTAAARLVVMHGYADVTSALVWIQAEAPGPIRIAWRADGSEREQFMTLDASPSQELAVVARLSGLAPGAGARYRIEGDGDVRE